MQQVIAREVVSGDVAQIKALGRRVFEMPHVEIKASPVQQKTAVARRFFVIAIVQVDGADLSFVEKVILNNARPHVRAPVRLLVGHQAAVFRFDADDAIHGKKESRKMLHDTVALKHGL